MGEILVKNQVCENCGAEVRLNALFCYNCGSQVAPDELVEAQENESGVSNAWFKDSITEQKESPIVKPQTELPTVNKIIDKSGLELTPLAVAEPTPIESKPKSVETEKEPIKTENKPLKTASSMRQKPKLVQKKQIEVTWEPPQNSPNIWFLSVAIILLLLAVTFVLTMLYIR